ncbi:hypothetical protein TH63_02395 [Rufibacter radiotolerans]|uniref:PKD domain-containing protein n=1 Tax=Rufibacter radiotolerans TaxID=1379910 RepID=A0A0H4VLE3_9BACT|nr:T9SS type A sorting domain-containing protein [Rufibacter radiotolerans]AKQ44732.1 hypothetical protein TH63_02395 [Rufibacter radiotolerans]
MVTNLSLTKGNSFFSLKPFTVLWVLSLLPCFFLFSSLALGQVKQWDKTYGGAGNDELEHLQHTQDGGYILGGTTYSGISGTKTQASRGGADYWIVKIDAAGNKQWDFNFGGSGRDELAAVQQTSDGGYILGGLSESPISGDKTTARVGSIGTDYWVIKLNADGLKQWDVTVGGTSTDVLEDLIQTSDGGYFLGGWSSSGVGEDKTEPSRGGIDYWVVKLSATGVKLWDKTFGGNAQDILHTVLQTTDGGYLLGGGSVSPVSGDKTDPQKRFCDDECEFDFWLVKINATGGKEWDRTIGGEGGGESGESLIDMVPTTDGGFLLGGSSDSQASYDKTEPNKSSYSDSRDYWVVKINATGVIQWDRTLGGDGDERLGALLATTDGGFLVGGRSNSDVSDDKTEPRRDNDVNAGDYWVVKINAMGTKLWDKTFGGSKDDVLTSLANSGDGGYLLGGSSDSPVSGDKTQPNLGGYDYWAVKMSEAACTTPTPAIALTPTSSTYTGGDPSQIYLGYGPQSVTLTASGGTTYSWSPAMGLNSTNTATTTFSPTLPGTYTFTVTAANGSCTATASVTITVTDVRCGPMDSKVMVCHNGKSLCVSSLAVKAHLEHHPEDKLGDCEAPDGLPTQRPFLASLHAYPNPFTTSVTLAFTFPQAQEYTLEIYSSTGTLMKRWPSAKAKANEQVLLTWAPTQAENGFYMVRLFTKHGAQTLLLLRQ